MNNLNTRIILINQYFRLFFKFYTPPISNLYIHQFSRQFDLAVECEPLQSKPSRLKRHITYRKQSPINNNIFAADLRSFNLNADEADPVVLLAAYDICLRTIIDAHAPLVSRTITVRPTTPWHTNDLTEAKRALRRAERLWRNSSLTVHRQIFKTVATSSGNC